MGKPHGRFSKPGMQVGPCQIVRATAFSQCGTRFSDLTLGADRRGEAERNYLNLIQHHQYVWHFYTVENIFVICLKSGRRRVSLSPALCLLRLAIGTAHPQEALPTSTELDRATPLRRRNRAKPICWNTFLKFQARVTFSPHFWKVF
jgi:hypothetical protein